MLALLAVDDGQIFICKSRSFLLQLSVLELFCTELVYGERSLLVCESNLINFSSIDIYCIYLLLHKKDYLCAYLYAKNKFSRQTEMHHVMLGGLRMRLIHEISAECNVEREAVGGIREYLYPGFCVT